MRRLVAHSWPGNVRGLSNLLERAVAMTDHGTIVPEDLDFAEHGGDTGALLETANGALPLEQVARAYVCRVVDAHGGNKAAAARARDQPANAISQARGLTVSGREAVSTGPAGRVTRLRTTPASTLGRTLRRGPQVHRRVAPSLEQGAGRAQRQPGDGLRGHRRGGPRAR
jgi:hypothetical protein